MRQPPLEPKGGQRTPSVSSRVGSKLPLPLYADVRLHTPMTHRDDVIRYGGYGPTDCAESPNGVALCTEFRTDNTGPPTTTAGVQVSLNKLRSEYPGATIKTSTFDVRTVRCITRNHRGRENNARNHNQTLRPLGTPPTPSPSPLVQIPLILC